MAKIFWTFTRCDEIFGGLMNYENVSSSDKLLWKSNRIFGEMIKAEALPILE
jgi:hypothetical protein